MTEGNWPRVRKQLLKFSASPSVSNFCTCNTKLDILQKTFCRDTEWTGEYFKLSFFYRELTAAGYFDILAVCSLIMGFHQIKKCIMYFFWQAAFSILLWSNTDNRVTLPKDMIPPHQCAATWKFSPSLSSVLPSSFSVKEELGISSQYLKVLRLPSALHTGRMTRWRHILSVCRKWVWRTNSTRCLIWTGLKMDERNPGLADSLLSLCSVCIFLPCLQGFGCLGWFFFRLKAAPNAFITQKHLDQSFIMPTLN